jgi:superfamily II DNA or RNA helicase
MQLRPYQLNAILNIREACRKAVKSILVVSPTGSGKSVVLAEIIRSAHDKGSTVLFLVHRRELLFQISERLNGMGISHGIHLAGEEYEGGHLVELATFQTMGRRMERYNFQKAQIVIVDEAHVSTAEKFKAVIDAHRENLLIGFTATPCRNTGYGLGTMYDHMVNVATIADLTRDGHLVPVRYYAPSEPDLKGVKITAGDYNGGQLEKVMKDPQLVGDVVENWIRLAEDRLTVVFTTTVAHSVAVCEAFNDAGIPAEHVDGKTDKEERAAILFRFRSGDTRILCNCCVFIEGVDIPDIACVVMARPTKSLGLYLQTMGRGMRPTSAAKDLIYIDHAGACYEHGPVDEITEWTLDETIKNTNAKNDERKERNSRPLTCGMCSNVYTGRLKCPQCGTIPDMTRMGKEVDFIDAELGEVCFKTKTAKIPKATMEDKQRWYSELTGYAREKGFKPGWIYHKYRAKWGINPHHSLDAKPVAVTPEVRAWIRGQAARAAMAKQKGVTL